MARFNTPAAKAAVHSPITGETSASGRTFEGGAGFARDAKSELFLLAVTNFVSTDTFYEKAGARDERFESLIHQVAVQDPDWIGRFVPWLRNEANMRTASLVAAAEAVKARLAAGLSGDNRTLIDAACQRADEPGELLAYWTSRHGRTLPKPVKRGIADAAARLYTERSLLKYDTATKGYRFGDVIDLVHPSPAADKPWQGELFRHALDRRHQRGNEIPDRLVMLIEREKLMNTPMDQRGAALANHPELLGRAGMTWESLAGWLQGPMDALAWQTVIPSMGYMALLRNLRNFDEAGVSDEIAQGVAAKLQDADEVARSRQLPFRFLSAYRAAPSLRWAYPLEVAIGRSLANVPALAGRTLILVDTSGSMDSGFSKDGTLMRWDAAALFGIALGHRCAAADVVSFSGGGWGSGHLVKPFPLSRGESVLRSLERWKNGGWFINGGTDTAAALRATFAGHDRVVILTDEQAAYDDAGVSGSVPAHVPMYTWNLAGYERGHAPSGTGNRHTFGGLTDQGFKMIPLLESGRDGSWPF